MSAIPAEQLSWTFEKIQENTEDDNDFIDMLTDPQVQTVLTAVFKSRCEERKVEASASRIADEDASTLADMENDWFKTTPTEDQTGVSSVEPSLPTIDDLNTIASTACTTASSNKKRLLVTTRDINCQKHQASQAVRSYNPNCHRN